jgi:hypothetical protein
LSAALTSSVNTISRDVRKTTVHILIILIKYLRYPLLPRSPGEIARESAAHASMGWPLALMHG